MRYQQKQRQINKTERQRFEMQNQTYKTRSRRCLSDAVERFRIEHINLIGDGGRFNQELDWTSFLKEQDGRFGSAMSHMRSRGSSKQHQRKEILMWSHMMNTFKNAVKIGNSTGADGRYRDALLVLNNISVVY